MEYTVNEWQQELSRRFGPRCEDYKFICPHCGRINQGIEFFEAGAKTDDIAQCCIGRFVKGTGCDWAAYGLFGTLQRGDVVIMPDGKRRMVFAMAPTQNAITGEHVKWGGKVTGE